MARGRALLTETQRECLAGKEGEERMYQERSRIRTRIQEPLADDIAHLAEHAPELLEELREVVCEKETDESDE